MNRSLNYIYFFIAEERQIQVAETQSASNLLAEIGSSTENGNNLMKTKIDQNRSLTAKPLHSRFK